MNFPSFPRFSSFRTRAIDFSHQAEELFGLREKLSAPPRLDENPSKPQEVSVGQAQRPSDSPKARTITFTIKEEELEKKVEENQEEQENQPLLPSEVPKSSESSIFPSFSFFLSDFSHARLVFLLGFSFFLILFLVFVVFSLLLVWPRC